MTPAIRNITIPRGGRFAELYTFLQTGTSTPVDLTGLSPFVAQVRSGSRKPVILELTVTDTDLDAGQVTVSSEVEDNTDCVPGVYQWGLRDDDGNIYIEGSATIEGIIPE